MPITTEIVNWNADDAKRELATTKRNRPTSRTTVNRYRSDMESGRWSFNGEAIKYDTEGANIDGGHRLTALSETDGTVYVQFLVVRGLPTASQLTMDRARIRTAGQQLQMTGIPNGNIVASGVRLFLSSRDGYLFRDNRLAAEKVTTAYIEEWTSENSDIVAFIGKFLTDVKAADAPPSVAYAAAILFTTVNPRATPEFFHILAKGAGNAEHPITVLDKRLQKHRREGIKISSRDTLGLYVQAWNAWRTGRTLTKFQRPRGGHWTEATFPRPVAR